MSAILQKKREQGFQPLKNYLELHFTRVKTIDAKAYKTEMSAGYDVTIFDANITAFKERRQTRRDDGTILIEPASYLTEDFDHAVVFVGHVAPDMGESIGLKLNRACQLTQKIIIPSC